MRDMKWTEERVVGASCDDVRALLPRVIARAFGDDFVQVEPGHWRVAIEQLSKTVDLDIKAEPDGRDTLVTMGVHGKRTMLAKAGVGLLMTLTGLMWLIVGVFFVFNWRRTGASGVAALMLLVPTILTLLATRVAKAARLEGMDLLGHVDTLMAGLRELDDAPRKGNYRDGPRIAAAVEAEREALAEAEAEAEERSTASR